MQYLGLVKWFNHEKGFGIIGSPAIGDVFLHISNIDFKPPEKFKATALLFNSQTERGKLTAIDVSYPSDFDDFSLIQSYLTKDVFIPIEINVTGKSRWGNPYKRKENRSYDSVKIALAQLFKERPLEDVISYYKQYFDDNYSGTDKSDFLKFLTSFKDIFHYLDLDNWKDEAESLIDYFLNSIQSKTLFQVWKNKLHLVNDHQFIGIGSQESRESSFDFPQKIFIENYSGVDQKDLERILSMSNGIQIIENILSRRLEVLSSMDKEEIILLSKSLRYIKDEEVLESIKQHFAKKLLELMIQLDYSDISDTLIRDFHFILAKIESDLGKPYEEEVVSEFNKSITDNIAFILWQKTRYFKPDSDFLQKNYSRLTYEDFINGSEPFLKRYFQERLNEIGEIKDIKAFGLLVCIVVETSVKTIHEILELLPFKFQLSLWLSFPRLESYQGKFYEADYERSDFRIDVKKIRSFLSDLDSIDEILSIWNLAIKIQKEYSLRTSSYGGAAGFRNLESEARAELVEQLLFNQDAINTDFLTSILDRLDENDIPEIFALLIPRLFSLDDDISIEELTELIQRLKISRLTQIRLYDHISQSTTRNNCVKLWYNGYSTHINPKDAIEEFHTFSEDKQPRLFRKIFSLFHSRKVELTNDLFQLLMSILDKENINLNVRICLEVIGSLRIDQDYIGENIISEIICSFLNEDISEIIQVTDLFEECKGRTWMTEGEQERSWYLRIEGKEFPVSDDSVEIGDIHYDFDKENRSVEIDGIDYQFRWVKKEQNTFSKVYEPPAGVTFCDAVKSEYEEKLKHHFHWCCNAKCYDPCQNDHIQMEWNKYSLRDFIKILKLPFDEDKYYRFVSIINRANRILKKLQCTSCNRLLRDAKTSEFAFYRVTTFHCTNPDCEEYHKVVYLNHCLNWRCLNIVDSRISKKCPNGWFICDSCNNCCSQEKIDRRYNNLITNNAFNPDNPRHQKLKYQVEGKFGHLEKGEKYDYKTGAKSDDSLQ
ncbi:MAG: cold shock domain-containing protein [Bacteroidota bacterium]